MKLITKITSIVLMTLLFTSNTFAQFKHPAKSNQKIDKQNIKNLNLPSDLKSNPKISTGSNTYAVQSNLSVPTIDYKRTDIIKDGEQPIYIKAHFPSKRSNTKLKAIEFLDFVKEDMKIRNPSEEFEFLMETVDKLGGKHMKYNQVYNGIPIYGKEIMVHDLGTENMSLTGRFLPSFSNDIPTKATISDTKALEIANADVKAYTSVKPIAESLRKQIGMPDYQSEIVYYTKDDKVDLAIHLSLYPNATERWEYFINATTGDVIRGYKNSCSFAADHNYESTAHNCENTHSNTETSKESVDFISPMGDETANATDLNGVTRSIHTYSQNGTYFLIDASLSMYNSNQSNMPDEPNGVLWTIDGQNQSPSSSSFGAAHVTSSNNSWNNPKGISAHYNAKEAYNYFKNTHGRNSINGQGGNVVSLINITDESGDQMDNAYWNGYAIFYGNGDQAFSPLQGSLDVGGHEMSHGVIQNTANLEYLSQSGAMNESFADAFGCMIDNNDWQLGESIVNTNIFTSGALRDMSNPHNGASQGGNGWQPKTMSEYQNLPETPQGDNGGVHVNSGILNYAFYLVATSIGKNNAEDIYYHALKNYLVRSSQFIDLRVALVKSATQLFSAGSTEVAAVENSFNTVGIGSGTTGGGGTTDPGNDHQTDIPQNNGSEKILTVGTAQQFLYLSDIDGSNTGQISNSQTSSNPSITDDGQYIVFIANDNTMKLTYLDWDAGTFEESTLQDEPIWRNVIISKDGNRIAALTTDNDNVVQVFDFTINAWQAYELYNPTYTQGVSTGDVQYADAMEFDITGEYIIYDAFNELNSSFGTNIDYWDIGFLKVWDNSGNNWGDGNIGKLFSGLPENTSVGNPAFAKNSPYIVAFDFIDAEGNFILMSTNTQTGETSDPAIFTNGVINYPSFSNDDSKIIFNAQSNDGTDIIAQVEMQSDKINSVSGSAAGLIGNQQWGHWFALGERDLIATENMDRINELALFPNPTSDNIQISIDVTESMEGTMQVFNLLGKKIMTQDLNFKSGTNNVLIDLTALNKGNYILDFRLGDQQFSRQISKM